MLILGDGYICVQCAFNRPRAYGYGNGKLGRVAHENLFVFSQVACRSGIARFATYFALVACEAVNFMNGPNLSFRIGAPDYIMQSFLNATLMVKSTQPINNACHLAMAPNPVFYFKRTTTGYVTSAGSYRRARRSVRVSPPPAAG